jgi:hypothetical protein
MKSLMQGTLFVLTLSGIATPAATPPPESAAELAKTWQGKSVALSAQPIGRFMAWTRTNIALGMLGGAAAAAAEGNHLVTNNGIDNQAPRIARALLDLARKHFGVVAAPLTPLSLAAPDVAAVARAARGADLVFDVQPLRESLEPFMAKGGEYFVTSDVRFRIVEVGSGRVLAEKTCVRTTQVDPVLPSREEWLANHAERLKAALAKQGDSCLDTFEVVVLGISGGDRQ